MEKVSAPPFWRMALRGNGLADDVPVDRWQICRFTPPSHVMIEVGVAHAGKGGYAGRSGTQGIEHRGRLHHAETDTSIWYFWGMARNFEPGDAELTADDPRRPGQDLRRRPRDAGAATAQPAGAPSALLAQAQHRRRRRAVAARDRAAHRAGRTGSRRRCRRLSAMQAIELNVRVARKTAEALDICAFELVRADGSALPAFSAGSHIDVQPADRHHAPVLAVQRRRRDPPLPDRRAARSGLARRIRAMHDAGQRGRPAPHRGAAEPLRARRRGAAQPAAGRRHRRHAAAEHGGKSWRRPAGRSRCTTAPARPSARRSATASPRPRSPGRSASISTTASTRRSSTSTARSARHAGRHPSLRVRTAGLHRLGARARARRGLGRIEAALRVLRCRGRGVGDRRRVRRQARELGARDPRHRRTNRRPGAFTSRGRDPGLLRTGRVRHLPHACSRANPSARTCT